MKTRGFLYKRYRRFLVKHKATKVPKGAILMTADVLGLDSSIPHS